MNIDVLLISNLETLACLEDNESELQNNGFKQRIPFGNIAFIKEKFWKLGEKYLEPHNKRSSHPGLSVSTKDDKVVFGSSQTDNRFGPNFFSVKPTECPILTKEVVFILDTYIYATISMIDYKKTSYEPLCEEKMKELRNAGYN